MMSHAHAPVNNVESMYNTDRIRIVIAIVTRANSWTGRNRVIFGLGDKFVCPWHYTLGPSYSPGPYITSL